MSSYQGKKNFYNVKDKMLIEEIKKLEYDSVKVFYLNSNKLKTRVFSLKVDTPYIYNLMGKSSDPTCVDGSKTEDKGKLIQKGDGKMLLKILKNSYRDIYINEGVSPFRPTVGFVFFRNGIVYSHVDISLFDGIIELEIFDNRDIPFRYYWGLIGMKTNSTLTLLLKKYQLPNWVLD